MRKRSDKNLCYAGAGWLVCFLLMGTGEWLIPAWSLQHPKARVGEGLLMPSSLGTVQAAGKERREEASPVPEWGGFPAAREWL